MSDMTVVTTNELNLIAEEIATQRALEAEASAKKKIITEAVEQAENRAIELLEAAGLKSYKAPAGAIGITAKSSVKTPKTPEQIAAFHGWLKEKGLYDSMISVNSQKLNGLYRDEFEAARERGDVDFEIPGLTEVTLNKSLTFSRR